MVVRVGLTEEVLFEQGPEGDEDMSRVDSGDSRSRQRGQRVQMPCGRSLLVVFWEP